MALGTFALDLAMQGIGRCPMAGFAAVACLGAQQLVGERLAAMLRELWPGMIAVARHAVLLSQLLVKRGFPRCSHRRFAGDRRCGDQHAFSRSYTNARRGVAGGAALAGCTTQRCVTSETVGRQFGVSLDKRAWADHQVWIDEYQRHQCD